MKEFKASVKIPIYHGTIKLFIVNSPEKYNQVVKSLGCKDDMENSIAETACTIHRKDRLEVAMIFNYKSLGESVISHEASHVADYIIERIGARVCSATKEPRAYLEQWIVQWIGKQLVKARMKTECF
jgi:hypothetical protein